MTRFAAFSIALGLLAGASACKRTASTPSAAAPADEVATAGPDGRVAVRVTADGYHPATVQTAPGRPLTLVFTRTSNDGCGNQLVFPSLNIRRDLPLNQPVEVALTPTAGNVAFTCGMGMMHGAVVAR